MQWILKKMVMLPKNNSESCSLAREVMMGKIKLYNIKSQPILHNA